MKSSFGGIKEIKRYVEKNFNKLKVWECNDWLDNKDNRDFIKQQRTNKLAWNVVENVLGLTTIENLDTGLKEILRRFNQKCPKCKRPVENCWCGCRYNVKKDKWEYKLLKNY